MVAESTAAPPLHDSCPPAPPKSTSYWPAFPTTLQLPTLERVRASISTHPHPHPPVKVVKPDWVIHHTTAIESPEDSVPNLKATWLGHAVRTQVSSLLLTPNADTVLACTFLSY